VESKNQCTERKYNYKLGYVRGLAIIEVVLAHTSLGGLSYYPGLSVFFAWFSPFSFAIPVFFFVSGYFFEETAKLFGYIKKRFRRLIITYYSWNLFYLVVFFVVTSIGFLQWAAKISLWTFFIQPWTTADQYAFNLAAWFVPCLFLVQIAFVLLRKSLGTFKLTNEYFLFAFFLALGLTGTYLISIGYTNSFYLILDRTLFGLPFIQLGYLYKAKLEKFDKPSYTTIFTSIILLVSIQYALLSFYGSLNFDLLSVTFHGRILEPFLSSFTGIWLCLIISTVFAKIFEPKKAPSRALKYIGENTWSIMINQFLGFYLLSTVFFAIGAPGFNIVSYKTDLFYDYLINGDPRSQILYLAVGLLFPLFMTFCLTKLSAKTKNIFKRESKPQFSPGQNKYKIPKIFQSAKRKIMETLRFHKREDIPKT